MTATFNESGCSRVGVGRTSWTCRCFRIAERAAQLLREARWILFIALALFLALILFTYDRNDPGWSHAVSSQNIHDAGGRVGAWFADLLLYLFGLSAYLFVGLAVSSVWRGYRQLRPQLPAEATPAGKTRRRARTVVAAELARKNEAGSPGKSGWASSRCCLGCAALEASRLHSLDVSLPLAPGGLFGLLISDPADRPCSARVGGTLAAVRGGGRRA